MTRYEQGFMNKCAEYGVDGQTARQMLKVAWPWSSKKDDSIYLDKVPHESSDTFLPSLGKKPKYHSLATAFQKSMKPNTVGQLLLTLDDKDPNILKEYTVATDAPDSWSESDEWKLIAHGVDTMRKNKIKRLLIAMTNSGKNSSPYRVWTGDVVSPKSKMDDGNDISSLFFNGEGIRLN